VVANNNQIMETNNIISLSAYRYRRAGRILDAIDKVICRSNLRQATALVRSNFPDTKLRDAWTYHYGRGDWEFHAPDGFCWYGCADGAYDARYRGWMAWLESKGITEE
jgi:hypothetical protein